MIIFYIILSSFLLSNYDYSLIDNNESSYTYGENVWLPNYQDYMTIHYFTTQSWAGWTSTFWQLSDFYEEIVNDYGYEKVVIIGVGRDNMELSNENFCLNSNLPLVMDDFPSLPIHDQFNDSEAHDMVFLNQNGDYITTIEILSVNDYTKNLILNVIDENYVNILLGDLNNDQIINILDIVIIVNNILQSIYDGNGDMNSDGILNIQDIIIINNIIID